MVFPTGESYRLLEAVRAFACFQFPIRNSDHGHESGALLPIVVRLGDAREAVTLAAIEQYVQPKPCLQIMFALRVRHAARLDGACMH